MALDLRSPKAILFAAILTTLGLAAVRFVPVAPVHAAPAAAAPAVVAPAPAAPEAASVPAPRDHVAGIKRETRELSWTPFPGATAQSLYFGPEEQLPAAPVARLPGNAGKAPVSGALEFGKRYYWRVDHQINGKNVQGPTWAFRTEDKPSDDDLTFFVVSDLHYGISREGDEGLPYLVTQMNWLPGTPYPEKIGGTVGTPRGVINIGDNATDGKESQFALFVRDYGLTGKEGKLAYPVYETFGNHDGSPVVRKLIKERNPNRVGITHLSENGLFYSWDWNNIHFVNLGISPGPTTRPYDPEHSIDFARKDLTEKVGSSGRPVILMHHFGFDKGHSLNWWPDAWRTTYYDLLKDYNVIGILHGHAHKAEIYTWKDLDIYHPPHFGQPGPKNTGPLKHGFFVFHISGDTLTVVERKNDDTWGMTATKTIKKGAAQAK